MDTFQGPPLKPPKLAFVMQNMGFQESEENLEGKDGKGTPLRPIGPFVEFKNLFILLKFCGLTLSKEAIFSWPPQSVSKSRLIFYLVLQITGVLALWAYVIRSWTAFHFFPSEDSVINSSRIIACIWSTQCALQATVCAVRWYKIPGVKSPFQEFCSFFSENQKLLSSFVKEGYCAKIIRAFLICITCFLIMNTALGSYVLFTGEERLQNIWIEPIPNTLAFKLAFLFLFNPYLSLTFLAPIGYYLVFCLFIFHQCNNLEKMMKTCLERNNLKRIRDLRRIHCCICDEITKADELFTYISFVVYVTMIPFTCYLLYTFLFASSTSLALQVSMGAWTAACVIVLTVYSFAGALLNTKVHSLITYLQGMTMPDMDLKTHAELMLFVSKLNGQPVAFTAGRIVVIDNALITTVYGVVLTYFALLYQLK